MTGKQVGKRVIQIIVVLFGISFLTFGLMYLAPGDPVRAMYASAGSIPDEEVIAQTREEMGLNRPFLVQYGSWLSGVLKGDMGTSLTLKKPVVEIMTARLWPTLKMALFAIALVILFSFPLGMFTAVHHNRAADYIVRSLTFIGNSLPSFWVALMLMYFFALKLGVFPVMSTGTGFQDLVLPSVTLAISMTAVYTRQVKAAVLDELQQGYVRGGQLRGLKQRTILWRHVLKNAMLPLVTLLGLSFGSLLGGTTVVEVIFSYPGLGNMAVQAVTNRDYPLIQGYVLWIALIYMVINLLVDISYEFLDPRTKERLRG